MGRLICVSQTEAERTGYFERQSKISKWNFQTESCVPLPVLGPASVVKLVPDSL